MKSTIAVICAIATLTMVTPVQSASFGFNFDKFGWRITLPDLRLPIRKKSAPKATPEARTPTPACVDDTQSYEAVGKMGYAGTSVTRELNKEILVVSAVRGSDKFVITLDCDGNIKGIVPVGS